MMNENEFAPLARVIAFCRTPSDGGRDWASGTAGADVPQMIAAKLARAIDARGNDGAGEYLPRFALRAGWKLAAGHGVTVVYKSGARRSYTE